MRRHFGLLMILSLLTGCGFFWCTEPDLVKRIDASDISRVILVYSEKLRFEKDLVLENSHVYYDHYVNRIRLDFYTMENVYVWGAREMLVDLVEGLLGRLNMHSSITSQFINPPITPENLEIYINHKSFYNHYIDQRRVGLAQLRDGIATYFAADALDCDTDCWHRLQEYYWQSREFVQSKRFGEAAYSPLHKPFQSVFGDDRIIELMREPEHPEFLWKHNNTAPELYHTTYDDYQTYY